MNLMDRDRFRDTVFYRDKHKCVIHKDISAQDAHHITERRLWENGGYYVENGASLCAQCHLEAEMTVLSCDEIRAAAGIDQIVLPEHLYPDYNYDKWGNIILDNGNRLKGELFYDESVQKILGKGKVLDKFIEYVKYPRTYHLPWSASRTQDDRTLASVKHFDGRYVIVTVKMDGENTTLYPDYMHARSIDSESHPSQSWVRNFQGQMGYNIPGGWRVCGENLFAKHSIRYKNLSSYFMCFSIWNKYNRCLSWIDTLEWAKLLDIEVVSTLYEGIWDEYKIRSLYDYYEGMWNDNIMEGYVVRVADSFGYGEFRTSVAKYVRKDHVKETVHNWKHQRIVKNELSGSC